MDGTKYQRSTSESSYLQSVIDKPQLHVFHNALAERIIFDDTNTAKGVCVAVNGTQFELTAKKEVILSAGAFQSPQLLMLSGIGPRSTLEAHNIPVRLDLPGVGQNLQDHPLFGTQHRINIPTLSAALNNPAVLSSLQTLYNEQAAGPLTLPAPGILGWEKLPQPYRSKLTAASCNALDTTFPSDWPELEYIPASAAVGYQTQYTTADPLDGSNYASILTSMVAPLSRGSVTLASANPHDLPLINPGYLTHHADAELAIAAIKRQRDIWAALSNITVGEEWLPGPDAQTDEQILEFVKKSLGPTWHASATCKMGKPEDRMAVVDCEGKVFGTEGLRVVDASAFPFTLPGHPQATVYAFAEKIADVILKGGRAAESERVAKSVRK